MTMKFRCKHAVEAMRWIDTDANRELFTDWFEREDRMFVTRGPVVVLPDTGSIGDGFSIGGDVPEGQWIVLMDGEFVAMDDEIFHESYEPATSAVA